MAEPRRPAMEATVLIVTLFVFGFCIGWALCSLGVKVKLSPEEKLKLIRQWRTELEERDRAAEAARRRASE